MSKPMPEIMGLQALCSPFAPYAGLKCWVPWKLIQKPDKAKPDKVPHNGRHGLSTNDPSDWRTLPEALAIASEWGLNGVGIVLTGGVTVDGKRLVGLDFDDVGEAFEVPFSSYCERSPSGKGVRAFVTVPAEWAASRQDNGRGHYPNCDHCEVYLGSGGRFLTVTGDAIESRPFAELSGSDLDKLDALLKKAEKTPAASVPSSDQAGAVIDLNTYPLTGEHRALIAGEIPAGQGKRHPLVRSLLLLLARHGVSAADAFATCMNEPGLMLYFSKHTDGEKFARTEIERAFSVAGPQLNELCEAYKKLNLPSQIGHGDSKPFKRKPISQLLVDIRPFNWLIEGVLSKGHLIALLGHPNSGKTAVATDLGLRLAIEMALGSRRVKRCRVVYIAAENPDEVKLRIKLWCDHHKVDVNALDDWFILIEQPVFFNDDAQAKALHDELVDAPPDLAIVDTFSANYSGKSENDATEVMPWFNNIRQYLIQPFGCTVMALHHPPKGSDNPMEWRGSGAAAGTLDGIWGVTNSDGTVTVEQGKRRGPPFDNLHWNLHTWPVKGLIDNFGNPVESIIAMPTGKSIDSIGNILEAKICACIDHGIVVQKEIAECIGTSQGTVSKTLAQMKTANDRHGKLVRESKGEPVLTAEGKKLAEQGRILLAGRLGGSPGKTG